MPGYKAGGPIRSVANMVGNLKDEFDFYIVTRNVDYCEITPYSSIRSDAWNQLSDGERVYYISSKKLSHSTLKKIINAKPWDVYYINGIYSYYFSILPALLLRKNKQNQVTIAPRGMLAKSAISIKVTKKKTFLSVAKLIGLYKNVAFHATNENEKNEIITELGEHTVRVVPNLPKKNTGIGWQQKIKKENELKLAIIARISPEKNQQFALELMKNLSGNVSLNLYGPVYNETYWSLCRKIISDLPHNISANYFGSVESDKIEKKLEEHHFLLMPTLGENFGHIILESLSVGCPVIISDQTPWKELENKRVGWDISLNNTEKFASVLQKCVNMGQEEYDELSKSAFVYAQSIINDSTVVDQYEKIFY
ncbi:MAG: hypothetical protein COA57_10355 [Flavobacteriales bacterium]|nr:MAG: hypothetical protein COA57_10355 [Flavobacteriales bacterium]